MDASGKPKPFLNLCRRLGRVVLHFAALCLQSYPYLLLYIAVVYLRPQEFMPEFKGTPLVPVLLLTTLGLWLIGQNKNFEAPQHRLILGLVAAMFISILLTGRPALAVSGVEDFLPTLLLFYVTSTSIVSLGRFKAMCLLLTIVMTVISVHGILQFEDEFSTGWTGSRLVDGRITYIGFLNDPNDLSMAFLMTLPLTLYLARVWYWLPVRLALWFAACINLYGIFLCNSRGSLLGLISMLFFYSVIRYGLKRSAIVGPLMILPILLLAPSRISEMSADEESAAGRVDAWFEGFDMFKSHPLFGIGKGLFTEHSWLTAHNSFVLAIAELGTVGYFFWLAIVVISILMLHRILSQKNAPGEIALAPKIQHRSSNQIPPTGPSGVESAPLAWDDVATAATSLSYSLIGSLVAAFFLSRSYVVFLFLLFALIIAVFQMARTRWPQIPSFRANEMIGMLFLVEICTMVFLWLVTRVLLITSG